MTFIADTNIQQSLIRFLESESHKVIDIKKIDPQMSDYQIAQLAQKEHAIIITHDKDFEAISNLTKYQCSIILVKLQNNKKANLIAHFQELLHNQSGDLLQNSIAIIYEDRASIYKFNQTT